MNKKIQYFQMPWKNVEVIETKDAGAPAKIRVRGYASTPDIDRHDDIVVPNAFGATMTTYMQNPIVLLGHDYSKPIGKVLEYTISDNGLEVYAEISQDVDGVMQCIADKVFRGFSIGFIAKWWEYTVSNNREIRQITDLDLIEISVVSVPANASALFTLSKSLKQFFDELPENERKSSTDADSNDESGEWEGAGDGSDTGEELQKEGESPDGEKPTDTPEKTQESESEIPPEDSEEVKSLKVQIELLQNEIRDTKLELESVQGELETKNASLIQYKKTADEIEQKNIELEKIIDKVGVSNGKIVSGSEVQKTQPIRKAVTYQSLGLIR